MKRKSEKPSVRIYILWVIFGVLVTATGTILVFWIYQEVARPIPMALLIGALIGVAYKLFSDSIKKEQAS